MLNLDYLSSLLSIDHDTGVVTMQAGIRLRDLRRRLTQHGLAMANLGSIDAQSIAGALATGTHGSSLQHGLLSESVLALKIILASGEIVECSPENKPDLFRAALVSLGALGVVVEVTYRAVKAFDIEWEQSLQSLDSVLDTWDRTLWVQAEFVRVWWLPYARRAIVWKASKTAPGTPRRPPTKKSWYGSLVGYHVYHNLLYFAQWFPSMLPTIEWFVFGMQYGFSTGATSTTTGIQEGQEGLLMDCLYSQFVNEWAIPLPKGPEAIRRFSSWIHGSPANISGIPLDNRGVYIHSPIEVRVSDTSTTDLSRKGYLDNTVPDGPTLYLNATLYRPYHKDPPCRKRYYEAFEWLMKDLGGRPHWAKNFETVSREEFRGMYGNDGESWREVRREVDPQGMFTGEWLRRNFLGEEDDDDIEEEKEKEKGLEAWG